jgi:Mn2+/Fe2+ NRAMP family transporter
MDTKCQAAVHRAGLTTVCEHDKMGGMIRKPIPSLLLLSLIVAGLAIPVAICVILALASLLATMGDAAGGVVLRYVALAGGIVWIMVLIGLIFAQAIYAASRSDDADE